MDYGKLSYKSGSENGCTPFIEFILGVIDETLSIEKDIPQTTRERILLQILNNPKITRRELAAVLSLTSDGVKYHLQKLTREGVIVHKGSTRSGYWEILK